MYDFFTLNYRGPSNSTTKRENRKGVVFVSGEHAEVFRSVAEIYKQAKDMHEIIGPVPVILAKDETKVKSRVAWEAKWDTLAGFCGPWDDHVCIPDYKPVVGSGVGGYNKVLDSFRTDKVGGFAKVVVVNSLDD